MTNSRKKARGARVKMVALMLGGSFCLCMGAFLFPVTAHAQSDTTPPILTAEVSGDELTVSATDDLSGVQGIYVDGHRISTLVNGGATVKLKDYHANGKEVAVYAMDNAGNKSESVKFPNPHYQAPAPLPAASAPAPASSSTPAASSSSSSQAAASSSSSSSSSSGGTQQPGTSAPQSSPSSSSTESAVPSSTSGSGFTPDGTGTVQDNATEADGKEFFTITTADGNVYYLIIDRQRGQENVYFLNAVTEADLLALAESGAIPGESAIPTPVEPAPDTSEPTPDSSEPGDGDSSTPAAEGGMGTFLFILLAALAVGGAGWYFKIYKPKQQAADAGNDFDDLDDVDDDGDYGLDVNDEPPFDLDDSDDEARRDAYEQDDGFVDDGE